VGFSACKDQPPQAEACATSRPITLSENGKRLTHHYAMQKEMQTANRYTSGPGLLL